MIFFHSNFFKRFFVSVLLCIACTYIYAQPGKDGAYTVTGSGEVLNKYSPVTADIVIGSSTVAAVLNATVMPLCAGDLIMVYQAQGAAINTVSAVSYGNITNYNSAGLYEFKYVQSVTGNVITTQTSFTNSYQYAGKVQVIKVPQYTGLTINAGAGIVCTPWKDTVIASTVYRLGGMVVIHAANIDNNGTISSAGSGFRGGTIYFNSGLYTGVTQFVSSSFTNGAEKGEGIAGAQNDYDLLGGRYCMGAPANGGGGGNSHNSGGGGGANGNNGNPYSGEGVMIANPANPLAAWTLSSWYIVNGALANSSGGGHGGYSWGNANANALIQGPGNTAWNGDTRREAGGIGGKPLPNINAETRIYFGGGGGAPEANNYATYSGANGGGIIYLIATGGITGTGLVNANGNAASNTNTLCSCDGAPGGGAGGSIVIKTGALAPAQNISANGGNGGTQLTLNSPGDQTIESEGPGGGGGGGFVALSSNAVIPSILGGINGSSLSGAVTEFPCNGATSGATGQTATVSNAFISYTPVATSTIIPASANAPVCVGNALTLSTAFGYSSYNWQGPNNFISALQNPTLVNTTTLMAGIYTVVAIPSNCPGTASGTVSVSFHPTPSVTIANTTVCAGITGTLTATGLSSYTWTPGNVPGNSFTDNPPATTPYTVTGTSAAGCTTSATASIIINSSPTLTFFTSSINCANLSSATVTAGGGTGPYSYSWNPAAQTGSVANNLYPGTYTLSVLDNGTGCLNTSITSFAPVTPLTGTVTTNTLTCNGAATGTAAILLSGGSATQNYLWDNAPGTAQAAATATGLYGGVHTVTVTDALTFCTLVKTFTITAPPPLLLIVSASSPTSCTGSGVGLNALCSGGTPGYTYAWNTGQATNTIAATAATAGTYTYSVTGNDLNNCTLTKTIAVSFIQTPTLTVSNAVVCQNAVAALAASGAGTYIWAPGNATGNTFTATPNTSTAYTVTGNSFGCMATAIASVTVNPIPNAAIAITNTFVCSGQVINLNATGNGSYTWSGPAAFTSTLQNPAINSATAANAGVYHLLVTAANNCTAGAAVTLSVLPSPAPVVGNATVCAGNNAVLHASGGVTYTWFGPAGYTSTQANAEIPLASQSAAGSYTVILTGANSCTSSSVVQLLVNNFPLPSPTITTKPTACVSEKIMLQGAGGDSYLWHGPANFVSASQNASLTVTGLNMSGIYTLSVKNASNCATSATVMIKVYPQPKGSLFNKGLRLCIPSCQDFKFNPDPANQAPVLSSTFTIDGNRFADTAITYCFKSAGSHTVNVSFTDSNSCVNTAAVSIIALDKPSANFEFFPESPVANVDNVMFTNTSLGAYQTEWYWFFTGREDSVKTKNTYHLFENAGDYPVAMVVKNKWGCTDTVIKALTINDEFSFYVPNAFTPNGDGINDAFQPKGTGITHYTMQVFDRWGQKLFETKDFYTGWDGTYKGAGCTDNTYVWKISATIAGGKLKIYTGFVNLIR